MGRQLTDLSFEEWTKHVFDHPVMDPAWYWDDDADLWDGPPVVTVTYIIRVFENADEIFKPYSDAQVNQGLWFLVNSACSDNMLALFDASVPPADRGRCLRSIFILFERYFAKRCSPHLSHLNEPGANPLNLVCYMWWDIFPFRGEPNDPNSAIAAELINVMKTALQLDSDACRESALHGLGHWRDYDSKKVETIIDEFLIQNPNIRPQLKKYALKARSGSVQ